MEEELVVGKRVMTLQPLGGGWAAVIMGVSDEGFGPFWEPDDVGFGRYATKEEAVPEAEAWAENEGIEFPR